MKTIVAIAMAMIFALAVEPQTSSPFTISGRVVHAGTTNGVNAVDVRLTDADERETSSNTSPVARTTTDQNGRFNITVKEPGPYRLVFLKDGYVRRELGQRALYGRGIPLTLNSGVRTDDFLVELNRTASVSGHMVGTNGLPLVGAELQLFRFVFDPSGNRSVKVVGMAESNDLGEFRFDLLTPGNLFLSTGSASMLTGGNGRGRNFVNVELTYYPGVSSVAESVPISVKPGEEREVTFRLEKKQFVMIRGRLERSATPATPAAPTTLLGGPIEVLYRLPDYYSSASTFLQFGCCSGVSFDESTGQFTIGLSSPGEYLLFAGNRRITGGLISAATNGAMASVVAKSGDIDGILVTPQDGQAVLGAVSVDGAQPTGLPAAAIRGELIPLINGKPVRVAPFGDSLTFTADSFGQFTLGSVFPGDYQMRFREVAKGFAITGIVCEASDASEPCNDRITVAAGRPNRVKILTSSTVGAIQGMAARDGVGLKEARVVAVPRDRTRNWSYRTVLSGANGSFRIDGVAPGDYDVFAWEDIEENAWFDPLILERSQAAAAAVQVGEARVTVVNPIVQESP